VTHDFKHVNKNLTDFLYAQKSGSAVSHKIASACEKTATLPLTLLCFKCSGAPTSTIQNISAACSALHASAMCPPLYLSMHNVFMIMKSNLHQYLHNRFLVSDTASHFLEMLTANQNRSYIAYLCIINYSLYWSRLCKNWCA